MIIFYNKQTGNIVGTIDGRTHSKEHLTMWVGSKEENERIIVQWKRELEHDKSGEVIAIQFTPDHKQADIFYNLDQHIEKVEDYRVDIHTLLLIKK